MSSQRMDDGITKSERRPKAELSSHSFSSHVLSVMLKDIGLVLHVDLHLSGNLAE